MPRIQFSLRTLLLFFIPVALAIAALVNANFYWANATLTVTLACLGASIIGWIWCLGRASAFWSGFTIFGCGYAILTFAPWFDEHIGINLISFQILEKSAGLAGHQPVIDPKVPSSVWEARQWCKEAELSKDQKISVMRPALHYFDYLFIGHCLFTLLSGLLGGFIGRWFYSRREIQASITEIGQPP
jgi:hypothetical protein